MKKKILVIDDDATIRFLLINILRDYEVISKEDGYEALSWLNSGNVPDLILLDMEMPNINGRVLIRRIKSSYKHRQVPIIVMSGTDSKLIKNNFLKLGASDYIIKPFADLDFLERVKKAMIVG
jgi:two-component system, chemotaxis family, chemotaxis protein CheY